MASESTHLTYKERLALTKERVKAANVGMSSESESVTPSVGARKKLLLTKKSKGPTGSATGTPSVGVRKDKGAEDASSMAKPLSGPKMASGTKKKVIEETEAEMALRKQNEELQRKLKEAQAKETERQRRKEEKRKEKEDAEKAKQKEQERVAKEMEEARVAQEKEDARIAKELEDKKKEEAKLEKEREEKEKEKKRMDLERQKKEEEDNKERKRKRIGLRQEKRSKKRSEVPRSPSNASKSSSFQSRSGVLRSELGEAETLIEDGNLAEYSTKEQQTTRVTPLKIIQPVNFITLNTASEEDNADRDEANSHEVASDSKNDGDEAPVTTSHGDVDPPLDEANDQVSKDGEDESDDALEEELEEGKLQSLEWEQPIRVVAQNEDNIRERMAKWTKTKYLEERPFDADYKGLPKSVIEQIEKRDWVHFCTEHDATKRDWVKEFFAGMDEDTMQATVRGKTVSWTAEVWNEMFGLPNGRADYDELLNDQTDENFQLVIDLLGVPGAEWNVSPQSRKLYHSELNGEARIWSGFIKNALMPIQHETTLTVQRAFLIFAIMSGMTINIGSIIVHELRSWKGRKTNAFIFPRFISELCRHQGVRSRPNDVTLKPTKCLAIDQKKKSSARVSTFKKKAIANFDQVARYTRETRNEQRKFLRYMLEREKVLQLYLDNPCDGPFELPEFPPIPPSSDDDDEAE